MLRLPEPMLARSGAIPTGRGWLYEPKLDGFRCLVCTHGGRFPARSRRGWNMTALLPELAEALPTNVQLDGELVAWDDLGLEGVVAKRERDPNRPGERDWLKTKNRATARFAQESARTRRGRSLTGSMRWPRAGREDARPSQRRLSGMSPHSLQSCPYPRLDSRR